MIKVEKCYELREKINIEKANEKRFMEVLRNVFMITERKKDQCYSRSDFIDRLLKLNIVQVQEHIQVLRNVFIIIERKKDHVIQEAILLIDY